MFQQFKVIIRIIEIFPYLYETRINIVVSSGNDTCPVVKQGLDGGTHLQRHICLAGFLSKEVCPGYGIGVNGHTPNVGYIRVGCRVSVNPNETQSTRLYRLSESTA